MFPSVGSQIFTEPCSPEDFHVMEVKNVSRDVMSVTGFGEIASAAKKCCGFLTALLVLVPVGKDLLGLFASSSEPVKWSFIFPALRVT